MNPLISEKSARESDVEMKLLLDPIFNRILIVNVSSFPFEARQPQ